MEEPKKLVKRFLTDPYMAWCCKQRQWQSLQITASTTNPSFYRLLVQVRAHLQYHNFIFLHILTNQPKYTTESNPLTVTHLSLWKMRNCDTAHSLLGFFYSNTLHTDCKIQFQFNLNYQNKYGEQIYIRIRRGNLHRWAWLLMCAYCKTDYSDARFNSLGANWA